MADLRGIAYLKNKLNQKKERVELRYRYYEMKNIVRYNFDSVPENMRWLKSVSGWCSKAVDSVADRLQFYQFENDNFSLNEIYQMNNPDVLFDSAVLSALIASCCFIYISADTEGYPRLQVIDAGNATGIINPTTGLMTEGYAVLESKNGVPTKEVYFIPGKTGYYLNGKLESVFESKAPYALLVPVIYRPDAVRPFGHSRISRSCMSHMKGAIRTVIRSEISAEFYSYPQKYLLGVDPDSVEEKWKATISSFLMVGNNENGENPKVGQFSQQSMTPFIDQIKSFAALFAGETGLTLDDLGYVADNPSSAEAIKASHENLKLAARKAQRNFGSGFLNAGYLAACVRDNYKYERRMFYLTKPEWEPIFEPDASVLSLIGDGAVKINQALPGYINVKNLRKLTGIDTDTVSATVDDGTENHG